MWITPGNTSSNRRPKATTSSSPLKMKGGFSNKGETEVPSPRLRASTKRETFCRREIGKMGSICKSGKSRPERDEQIDLDKQFGKGQVFDDKDSMWLSSDKYSPSSFFEDYRLSGSLRTSVDNWLVSWLSTLASSYLNIDKGGAESEKVKPNPDDSGSAPELQQVKSLRNNQDSASCSLASSDSPSAASSEAVGLDSASLLVSLFDLDDVDYSGRVLKLSGFPSPSCGSIWSSSEAGSSSSCNVWTTTSEGKLEGRNPSSNSLTSLSSESDSDEPIFWPFERELEWSSEKTWSRFSMSPRRDTIAIRSGTSRSTPTKPRPALSTSRGVVSDARESCRRQLPWDSNSANSKIPQSGVRNMNNVKKRAHHRPTPPRPVKAPMKMMVPKDGTNLVDGSIILEDYFAAIGKHPIEALLGLGEFDGHEGVDSEFNFDCFDLH